MPETSEPYIGMCHKLVLFGSLVKTISSEYVILIMLVMLRRARAPGQLISKWSKGEHEILDRIF